MLADHIEDGYDYLLWMDDDAGFVRFDDFRPFLEPLAEGEIFLFTHGGFGQESATDYLINAGVFFVKACAEAKEVLLALYAKRDDSLREKDQTALIRWARQNDRRWRFVPSHLFNARPMEDRVRSASVKANDASFIVHFPGDLKRWVPRYFGQRYSVLSYDFGGYDLPRQPKEINPLTSYIFVTDKDRPPSPFVKKVLETDEKNPLLNCQYVKHHPFEFVDTDWVVVMDSSIEIRRDLAPIVEFCEGNGIEALFVSSPYAVTFNKEMYSPTWTAARKMPQKQREIELEYLEKFKEDRLNIEGMFYVLKRTQMVERLLKSIADKCNELLRLGSFPRPCQVLYSATVANEFQNEVKSGKIAFMTSWQIRGGGSMMRIYGHGSNGILPAVKCREEVDILGKTIRPFDFKEHDPKVPVLEDDWED